MSLSFLSPPSLSSFNCRSQQVSLLVYLEQLSKKRNILNHKSTIFSCSATTSSLNLDKTHNENGVLSTIPGSNNVRSGKNIEDINIFSLPSSYKSYFNGTRSVELFNNPKNPPDHIAEFKQHLEELFDEVKRMIKIGNVEDALNLLQANYTYVKGQIIEGSKGIEQAAILDVLALGYLALGDFKMVKFLLDMLDGVVEGLKDDEPLLDSVLTHMGSMYSAVKKSEKSLLAYMRSLGILEKQYGLSSIVLVTPLLGMAKVLGSIGRATKAVEVYQRVISIFEICKGIETEDLVLPLLGLGNLLLKEKKAADAESVFVRIINIYTKLYGKNDRRVGMAMCSLAHVKCGEGNVDEAVEIYRKALQILQNSQSKKLDDEIMEKIRIDLAELLHSVGRGREGRELIEECLLITQNNKGKEHPSLVPHLVNLATSYSHIKSFVEAERLLRMSLNIMEKNVGPDDPSISFPMLNLAVTLHFLDQDKEAEQLALEALHLRENTFGKESVPVGEALDCLVSIQSKLGKDVKELLELSNRVLSIQEKAFGNESEEVMQTLKKIVFFLDKLGMKNDIFPLRKRLFMLKNKYKNMVRY